MIRPLIYILFIRSLDGLMELEEVSRLWFQIFCALLLYFKVLMCPDYDNCLSSLSSTLGDSIIYCPQHTNKTKGNLENIIPRSVTSWELRENILKKKYYISDYYSIIVSDILDSYFIKYCYNLFEFLKSFRYLTFLRDKYLLKVLKPYHNQYCPRYWIQKWWDFRFSRRIVLISSCLPDDGGSKSSLTSVNIYHIVRSKISEGIHL
jgi:hypothetical protein